MELGYSARVSTVKDDFERQIDALVREGIPRSTLYRILQPRPVDPLTAGDAPTGRAN